MDSKFADMISWCQAIANAYEAYSKGRMSKETYLAIFKEKLKDKPDLKSIEKFQTGRSAELIDMFGEEEDYEDCD